MNEYLQNLSKIFTDKLLRIPDYQRGYAWVDKHLNDFWNDIMLLDEDSKHYAGVLTLDGVPELEWSRWSEDHWVIGDRGYTPYYIVDGQQRLTTSIILIQCILEKFNDEDLINKTKVENIRSRYLFDSYDAEIAKSYIFDYEKDGDNSKFFRSYVLESDNLPHDFKDTVYTSNLKFAKEFFAEKLAPLSKPEIEMIFKKLTQQFTYNLYTISNELDVHVSFETMNNRGRPLTHLELLKNRLIYLSSKIQCSSRDRTQLRQHINATWSKLYSQLGRNSEKRLRDDIFLEAHYSLYFDLSDHEESPQGEGDLTEKVFVQESGYEQLLLDSVFTIERLKSGRIDINYISQYVLDLGKAIEMWYFIANPAESKFSQLEKQWLSKMNLLSSGEPDPLLLAVFVKEKEASSRVKFMETLERYSFLISISRSIRRVAHELDIMKTARGYYRNSITLTNLQKEISKASELLSGGTYAKYAISSISNLRNGYYKWLPLKYVLYEYEDALRAKMKENNKKIDNSWWLIKDIEDSIEHIYPQTANSDCWKQKFGNMAPQEKNNLKNTLGNLVVISGRKNSAFRNACFSTKKVSKVGGYGFKYGTYSEMQIAELDDWTPKEIIDRSLEILSFIEERWKIKLGTRKEKIAILGLQNIANKIGY